VQQKCFVVLVKDSVVGFVGEADVAVVCNFSISLYLLLFTILVV